jgi:hypothetical protein
MFHATKKTVTRRIFLRIEMEKLPREIIETILDFLEVPHLLCRVRLVNKNIEEHVLHNLKYARMKRIVRTLGKSIFLAPLKVLVCYNLPYKYKACMLFIALANTRKIKGHVIDTVYGNTEMIEETREEAANPCFYHLLPVKITCPGPTAFFATSHFRDTPNFALALVYAVSVIVTHNAYRICYENGTLSDKGVLLFKDTFYQMTWANYEDNSYCIDRLSRYFDAREYAETEFRAVGFDIRNLTRLDAFIPIYARRIEHDGGYALFSLLVNANTIDTEYRLSSREPFTPKFLPCGTWASLREMHAIDAYVDTCKKIGDKKREIEEQKRRKLIGT